jgi:3-oxoacyl-[acyl-carrier protein] reductase
MMRRALVTGGSGAIGSAICRALAAQGCEVIVHGHRNAEAAQAVAGGIVAAGGQAQAVAFDITDAAATAAALETIVEGGPVQVLVNNAGVHDDAAFPGMRAAQWHHVIDVSLHGFFHVTQPLLLPMIRTRWGRIVNIASVSALAGNRGQANYAAAKAGLIAAGKSLAIEVARRGVTVNSVAPGIIASPMTEAAFDDAAIKRLVPMQRAGTAQEVAQLVAFLVSDAAAYISGQCVSINGAVY